MASNLCYLNATCELDPDCPNFYVCTGMAEDVEDGDELRPEG